METSLAVRSRVINSTVKLHIYMELAMYDGVDLQLKKCIDVLRPNEVVESDLVDRQLVDATSQAESAHAQHIDIGVRMYYWIA